MIHQVDRKMMAAFSTNFTVKHEMVFALTKENVFLQSFYFKANRKTLCSSEKQ